MVCAWSSKTLANILKETDTCLWYYYAANNQQTRLYLIFHVLK